MLDILDEKIECKYWYKCSVNHCPLDPRRKERDISKLDAEQECILTKKARRAARRMHQAEQKGE